MRYRGRENPYCNILHLFARCWYTLHLNSVYRTVPRPLLSLSVASC